MNLNFLCCIGAELKNSVQQTTRMPQVYLYRAFEEETLADMLTTGFFNDALGIIRQDDLLLLYSPNETTAKWAYARVSSVSRDGVEIQEIGSSQPSGSFVKLDGTSIMTAPLKFASGSMRGAVGPYLNGVGFWKMSSGGTITQIATLSDSQFVPTTTNATDLGSSTKKWKDLYLSSKAYVGTINNGADISVPTTAGTMALTSDIKNSTVSVQLDGSAVDSFTLNQSSNKTINIPAANKNLSNLTSTGQNIANWSTNVSNCIIEIPQDIKLELNNGTLTLKTGSKVYVPNGVGVFDVVTIANNLTIDGGSWGFTGSGTLYYDYTNSVLTWYSSAVDSSGTTPPRTSNFYNTSTNTVYRYRQSVQYGQLSFPIAHITVINDVITSIDQVFNGFGYIGSTIYALPGVKGLIPNGRNEDGTLKNTVFTVGSVLTDTGSATGRVMVRLKADEIATGDLNYDETNNYNRHSNGSIRLYTVIGSLNRTSGVVSSFEPKTLFRAVDYSDSNYIANCAMPSDKYIDLTLGASGDTYIAPADGYFTIAKTSGDANAYLSIDVVSGSERIINQFVETSSATRSLALSVPVSKGNIAYIYYNATGTTKRFRFVYANGAK